MCWSAPAFTSSFSDRSLPRLGVSSAAHGEEHPRATLGQGRQARTTFDIDARTRGCTSPPSVVCALWPIALLSDDT